MSGPLGMPGAGSKVMGQYSDPRDTKKPDPRPAHEATTERKEPPKPVIREIYSDWAML